VSPVALALQLTAVPTVPDAGQLMLTERAVPATVTLWLEVVVALLVSTTVSVTVKVPLAV